MIQISVADEEFLFKLLDQLFHPISRVTPRSAPVGRILYGRWGLEDVVLVRCQASTIEPATADTSPSGGPAAREVPGVWEVHCHGGVLAVETILSSLSSVSSARSTVSPPNSEPAATTGRLDDLLTEALIQTSTRQTATWILRQMDGRLKSALQSILKHTTLFQAQQNQPEQNQSEQTQSSEGARQAALTQVDGILKWQQFAERLLVPARILIAGPPNAGKSSLINRLVGFNRSIVFDEPGTTRDLVEASTVYDGWPLQFVDSAGLRTATNDPIERAGIQAVRTVAASCDCCLLVQDATLLIGATRVTPAAIDDSGLEIQSLLDFLPASTATIRVANKGDLLTAEQQMQLQSLPESPCDFVISTLTGDGIEALFQAIITGIVPETPPESAVIPASPVISRLLLELRADLRQSNALSPRLVETLRLCIS